MKVLRPAPAPVTARTVRRDAYAAKEVLRLLARGDVVVLPSQLVYGLFCDATNRDAVERVRTLKGKAPKPLPVLASLESAGRFGLLSHRVQRAVALSWPSGLSFIVPRLPTIPEHVTLGPTVMLFSPDAWLAELADRAGFPLAATSANAAGDAPCLTAGEAFERFGKEVNLIVDGGTAPLGRNSSIVDATATPERLVRESAVRFDEAARVLPGLVRG